MTIVDLKGRVVFGAECTSLRTELKDLISTADGPFVLNLQEVSYIDSGGVGCLVGLFTSAKSTNKEMRFACANDKVMHVLRITKLLPILGMHTDEASAVASCAKN
ncbi:MAG: STAS domain-containing protein [Acidobacteriales bacterium]|nr:STAS domain-containing protein [Terriglobales bacterium]